MAICSATQATPAANAIRLARRLPLGSETALDTTVRSAATSGSARRRRRVQSGAKNKVAPAIISHGNTPMANSRQVSRWNTTTATKA